MQAFAGGCSGAITKTSVAPLERLKILFQVQGMMPLTQKSPLPPTYKYTSIFQALSLVVKEEGVLALYKGNGANVVRIVPTYALKFAFNDTIKGLVLKPGQDSKTLTFGQLFTIGGFAGAGQILITYPLELVSTRLALGRKMASNVQYKGIVDCFRATVQTEGFGALYKGITLSLAEGIPYVGLQMALYQFFQSLASADSHNVPWYWKLASGSAAGVLAHSLLFPGDTVRRRMQTNGIGGNPRIYRNTWDAIRKIWVREGVKGYYSGLWASIVRSIPGAAIQFYSYDVFKSWLGLHSD
jgi:hypothetical protein